MTPLSDDEVAALTRKVFGLPAHATEDELKAARSFAQESTYRRANSLSCLPAAQVKLARENVRTEESLS